VKPLTKSYSVHLAALQGALVPAGASAYRRYMSRLLRGGTRTAGSVMAAGSATFLAGAFMPVSRVYVERERQRKLEILLAHPVQWRAQTVLLGAGTIVLPAGVAVLAGEWDQGRAGGEQERLAGRRLAQAGAVLLAGGAAVFPVDLAARFTDPAGFALGRQPEWPFYGYVWVSLAGMAALGGALLQRSRTHAGFPRWPGWLNFGGAATFAGVLASTGDLPPLSIYGIELATGVALVLRGGQRQPSGDTGPRRH